MQSMTNTPIGLTVRQANPSVRLMHTKKQTGILGPVIPVWFLVYIRQTLRLVCWTAQSDRYVLHGLHRLPGNEVGIRSLIELWECGGWAEPQICNPTRCIWWTLRYSCTYTQPDQCLYRGFYVLLGIVLIMLHQCAVWSEPFYSLMWSCKDSGGLAHLFC